MWDDLLSNIIMCGSNDYLDDLADQLPIDFRTVAAKANKSRSDKLDEEIHINTIAGSQADAWKGLSIIGALAASIDGPPVIQVVPLVTCPPLTALGRAPRCLLLARSLLRNR